METQTLSSSIIQNFIPARKSNSRKGDNGIVLVIGGSYIYHGAPVLSSLAALRCGTDLVYTCVPKINVTPTRAISPNLIVIPLVDQKLTLGAVKKLVGALPRNLHSATIGMGLAIQEKKFSITSCQVSFGQGCPIIFRCQCVNSRSSTYFSSQKCCSDPPRWRI